MNAFEIQPSQFILSTIKKSKLITEYFFFVFIICNLNFMYFCSAIRRASLLLNVLNIKKYNGTYFNWIILRMSKYAIYALGGSKNLQLLPIKSAFSLNEDQDVLIENQKLKSRAKFKVGFSIQ